MIKLSKVKPNPNNPRLIKDEKFKKLCASIQAFGDKMMPLRPIVVDENFVILGGNMRYRALKELGYKEVPDEWIKQASELTDEEKKEFIVKDNVGFGEWDWDMLANEWDSDSLSEWGLDIPSLTEVQESQEPQQKTDTTIKLQYSEEEYYKVLEALQILGGTKEQAIWQALGL